MRWFIVILILSLVANFFLVKEAINDKGHIYNLSRDILKKNSVLKYWYTKSQDQASTGIVEKYTVDEIHRNIAGISSQLQQLSIKPRNLVNYSEAGLATEKHIITTIRDSVIKRQDTTEQVQTFNYKDEFFNVSGVQFAGQQILDIQGTDSIIQVIHWKRKRPWLWILSKKVYEQTIVNKNPANKIQYQKYIEIQP